MDDNVRVDLTGSGGGTGEGGREGTSEGAERENKEERGIVRDEGR